MRDNAPSPKVTIEGTTVSIVGAGFEHKVTVNSGETVEEALSRNGIDAAALGVDLLVDGKRKDASEVTEADLSDNQRLAAPPKQAALGC